ncbi:MAG: M48 family metalloprotease [Bryobacteraceae bacterium]|nr:M48 family metalloprotease [Bryobacteraceae bacterium]MCX7604792.1 M48 family metalloprotease [Bryobacteraceae bacterium]
MNSVKTVLLLGLLSGVLLAIGQAMGGAAGLQTALLFAIAMNFFSYFFSEKIALMASGAVRVSPTENPQIYYRLAPIVQRLCQRMGIPEPKLWVIPEQSPNAFATGRNPRHSSVAVTAGLLELMDDDELAGVIAHELGHIRNRDILISSIAATIAAAITFAARMFVFFGGGRHNDDEAPNPLASLALLLLAPIAALLIQMAISRTREFAADAEAARAIGSGRPLANALRKLEAWSKRIPLDVNPAMSHMFIIKPFSGESLMRLFSTHPPTAERIARLERMA